MKPGGYRDLLVWQRSRYLAIEVYRTTSRGEFRTEWALRDQMRRSALSAPSNIAEGHARISQRECARFYGIARGSLAELATQADIATSVGLLDPVLAVAWENECDELRAMLTSLITRSQAAAER
jgi:four helix bundle protein